MINTALHPLQDFHLRIQEDLRLARLHVQALELIDQDLSVLTDRLKSLYGDPENPQSLEGEQPCGPWDPSSVCELSSDEMNEIFGP